ncbi:MAG: NAD(P)/FAD-dependent oxidoreductase [Ignavibacteriales bacterium]|nr:MAG: NAD(P)/FAD-dependent oxidoreductase [Ignavibacteriales bacterium]
MKKRKVIIIGGGFGGISAAKLFNDERFDVLIIDKTNHHLFQPLLYQVASAALSPGDIAFPIREIFRNYKNIQVIMDEVISIDKESKLVISAAGRYEYDYLIIATGSRHSYFGKNEWEQFAPGLKTLKDGLLLRENILNSFEEAEKLGNSNEAKKYLTFVIVGGGPTGVEMAGAIAEIAKKTLLKDFRRIDPSATRIILLEGLPKILSAYPDSLSKHAVDVLNSLGVEVRLNTFMTDVNPDGVRVGEETIETVNIIWAAGNEISPLIKSLNIDTDKAGRAKVNADLSIPGNPEVFVIGDAALVMQDEKQLPGTAPVAMQEGRYVAHTIISGKDFEDRVHFRYLDKGDMATIGRAQAVANIRGLKLTGFFAWLAWCFIHIFYLIGFRNRFRVMAEWIWSYITFKRGIRLIVGKRGDG